MWLTLAKLPSLSSILLRYMAAESGRLEFEIF